MEKVEFGAAVDCYNRDYWEKRDGKPDNLYLQKDKSPSEAVAQLFQYSEQREGEAEPQTAELDCVELIEVAWWLAEIDVAGAKRFDEKYGAREFVLAAPGSTGVAGTALAVRTGGGGDKEYEDAGTPLGGEVTMISGPQKDTTVDLSKHLSSLPLCSRVMWRTFDGYVLDDDDFKNENTVKIGPDSYAAHPLGTFSLKEMATQVAKDCYEDAAKLVVLAKADLGKLTASVESTEKKIKECGEVIAQHKEAGTPPGDYAGVRKERKRLRRLRRRTQSEQGKCSKFITYYAEVTSLDHYVARFVRVVEIETYSPPY